MNDPLADVVRAHRLLTDFFDRFAALLREMDFLLSRPERAFDSIYKHPYTGLTQTMKLGITGEAGENCVAKSVIHAWAETRELQERAQWPQVFVGALLGFDSPANWSGPEVDLLVVKYLRSLADESRNQVRLLGQLRDALLADRRDWEPVERQWLPPQGLRIQPDQTFGYYVYRLPLTSVASRKDVETQVVVPLIERYRKLRA